MRILSDGGPSIFILASATEDSEAASPEPLLHWEVLVYRAKIRKIGIELEIFSSPFNVKRLEKLQYGWLCASFTRELGKSYETIFFYTKWIINSWVKFWSNVWLWTGKWDRPFSEMSLERDGGDQKPRNVPGKHPSPWKSCFCTLLWSLCSFLPLTSLCGFSPPCTTSHIGKL